MRRSLTPILLVILLTGCGGEGTDASAAAGPAAADASAAGQLPDQPSGGVTSGTHPFRAFVHVTATATDATKPAELPVLIEVQLARDGLPVADAVVTAGSVGKAVRANPSVAGRYVVDETGYSPWYEVSIESGDDVLKGVRLRAPALHSVSLPARPAKGQPTLVRWNPSHDSAVDDLQVRVFGWDEQKITYDGRATDSGELLLPATALPSRTTYAIQIRRGASQTLALPNSIAIVDITSTTETTVR